MKITNTQEGKDRCTFSFEGANAQDLAERISHMFEAEKYKLEEGRKEDGVYGIGNGVLRILFGAFIKRYKFRVVITEENDNTRLDFAKAMTGTSGGAIGYVKLKKEFARMIEKIKEL